MCLEEKLNRLIDADWFRKAHYEDLFSMIRSSSMREIELLSFASCEIRRRGKAGKIDIADRICEELDIKPIPWLAEARGRLSLLDPPSPANYRANTYVILRKGYEEFNGIYGAYVGSTTLTPEERFTQHTTENHRLAARGLPKNGIMLLRSLMFPFVKVPVALKRQYETAVHLALSLAIPKVTGDILDDYREWMPSFQPRLMAELEKETF